MPPEMFKQISVPRLTFVVRRLLRRSTFDARRFTGYDLDNAAREALAAMSRSAQRRFADRRLLFVQGIMPRSGTNFLFEMLLRMPQVAKSGIAFDELPILARPHTFDAVTDTLRDYHPPSAAAFGRLDWLCFAAAGLRNRLLDIAAPGSLTVVKEPHAFNVELFPAIFPQDKGVFIVRDGRYVVDSFMRSFARGRLSRTFEEVCEEYRASAEAIETLFASDPANARLIRYEDATANRAATVKTLLDWVGHPVDLAALDALDALPIYGSSVRSLDASGAVDWTPVVATDGYDPTRRKLDWSARHARTFDRVAGDANRRLGYS